MKPLDQMLAKRRTLSMSIDSWEMYKATPNWLRERMLAVNHFADEDKQFEIAEVLLSEAIDDGGQTDEHLLSLLIDSGANNPLELDMGLGRYHRPNQPGNLIFTTANSPSSIKGKGPFHSITFYIPPEVFDARARELLDGKPRSTDILHTKHFRDEAIEVLMKRLLQQFPGRPLAGQKMTSSDLVDDLIRRLLVVSGHQFREEKPREKLPSLAIQRALDYMHANLTADLSRDDLAQVAGVNPSHFTRLFRQTFGETPKRYLLKIRIDHAKNLLKNASRDLTLDQIATQCGFYNQSHFGLEFRRQVGTTPQMYRSYS